MPIFQTHYVYISAFDFTYLAFGVIASFVLLRTVSFGKECKVASSQFCNFVVYITSLRMYDFRSWCLNAIAFKPVYFFNLFQCMLRT